MIEVQHLRKNYGEFVAVDDISFTAPVGQIFGLLGPNGAGKSTTIGCISGLLTPSSGSIAVMGHDMAHQAKAAKQTLGIVPQELALYDDLSTVDNLRFWGSAYGLTGKALMTRVNDVLNYIGLADRARDLPRTFSGGMKRRLNFGCGIVHEPGVLLLDEPTVGVDPQSRERLFEMVEEQAAGGTCVLYTTHYMEEAERLCSDIAIVDHGKLIAMGTLKELRERVGERDILQLDGAFPEETTQSVIDGLKHTHIEDIDTLQLSTEHLTLSLSNGSHHLPVIFSALSDAGGHVHETHLKQPNLETLFIKLTGKALRK